MPPACVWAGTPLHLWTYICFSVSLHDPPHFASVRINILVGHWIEGHLHAPQVYCREGNGTPLQYSCLENPMDGGAWWAAVHGIAKSRAQLGHFTFTFNFHALEKEMATHSSILAWRIPGTGEPGRLPSIGSHKVRHDWSNLAAVADVLGLEKTLRKLNYREKKCLKSVGEFKKI